MDPKCFGSVLQEYNDVSRRNYLYMSLLRGDSGFTGLTYKSESGYNRDCSVEWNLNLKMVYTKLS